MWNTNTHPRLYLTTFQGFYDQCETLYQLLIGTDTLRKKDAIFYLSIQALSPAVKSTCICKHKTHLKNDNWNDRLHCFLLSLSYHDFKKGYSKETDQERPLNCIWLLENSTRQKQIVVTHFGYILSTYVAAQHIS